MTPTERVLYLDTDACRPSDDDVAFGLGEVRYPGTDSRAGERVDQVANLKYAISRLGVPGTTKRGVESELRARLYSTAMLRNTRGATAVLSTDKSNTCIQAILDNLDLYQYGVLTHHLGLGIPAVQITNCVPPDGPWGTEEDFARIRLYMKENDRATAAKVTLTFAGLKVMLDDEAAILISETARERSRRSAGDFRYKFVQRDGYPNVVRATRTLRKLSAPAFAESIVSALMDVDDVVLDAFDPSRFGGSEDRNLSDLRGRRATLVANASALRQELANLETRLLEVDSGGAPTLQGALFARFQTRYNEVADNELPDVLTRLARLTSRSMTVKLGSRNRH